MSHLDKYQADYSKGYLPPQNGVSFHHGKLCQHILAIFGQESKL